MHLTLVRLNRLTLLLVIQASHASVIVSTPGLSITVGASLTRNDLSARIRLLGQGGHSNHVVVLVDHLEVVAREEVGDCRELRTVAGAVVVELEQRNGKKLHVLGNGEDLCIRARLLENMLLDSRVEKLTLLGKLDQVQLLALLGTGAVARNERIHEGLEVGAPPLSQAVADLPVTIDTFASELGTGGSQALIETLLETLDFLVLGLDVVAGPEQLAFAP